MTQGCFMIRVLFLFLLIGVSGSMYASRPKIAAAGKGSAFKKQWEEEKKSAEKEQARKDFLEKTKTEEEKEKEKEEKEEESLPLFGEKIFKEDVSFSIRQTFSLSKINRKGQCHPKHRTTLSWVLPEKLDNLELSFSFSFFRPTIKYIDLGTWIQKNKLKFDEIDLIFSRSFESKNWSITPFWGGVYLSSKRKSHLFNKKTKTRYLDEKPSYIESRGFGVLFGIESIGELPWNFYSVSRLSCSVSGQNIHIRDRYRRSYYYEKISTPAVKSFLGIGWETTEILGKKLDIRAGYEMERWFEQLVFSKKYMEIQNSSLILSGFSIMAKIDF